MSTPTQQKTIPEQLTEALAQIETLNTEKASLTSNLETARTELATAKTNLETANAQIATLTGEKATLTGQLTEANAKITAKDTEIAGLKAKEQDLEKRADAKAKEMLAQVGQPTPTAPKPTNNPVATAPTLTGEDAAAEHYRQKYGIK